MFANSRSTGSSGGGSSSGNIVEFKAGRSNLTAGSSAEKRKIVADKTKGQVFIKQSSDQLMHFCWKNRETGAVVDDLIIFPGDTEFKKIKECPDGKVYMLKFKSSDERRLFWIQEPDTNADKDLEKKVNDALNKPPSVRAAARGGASERVASNAAQQANLDALAGGEDLGALGQLNQSQLMQLLSFMNPNGQGARDGSPASAAGGEKGNVSASELSQLHNLLVSMKGGKPGEAAAGGSGGRAGVELSDVITGEKVLDTVRSNEPRLSPHLPAHAGPSTRELEETVRAPQFREATDVFGRALQSGQMAPVLQQFGVSAEATAAASSGDLLEFAKRLTDAEQGGEKKAEGSSGEEAKEEPKEPEPKRGKPDDEQMDLD